MALNHMTTAEMVTCTSSWCEPGNPVRREFEDTPILVALLPQIDRAHGGLLEHQRVERDQLVARLVSLREAVDFRHDGRARCAYYLLEAHIQWALAEGDQATARLLRDLRDTLFPHGLEVVNFSYREEAGQASLLESRLTPGIEAILAGIPMQHGSLLDVVRAWIAAGRELGRLEAQYNTVRKPDQRRTMATARGTWMRAVTAVRALVRLADVRSPVILAALHLIEKTEAAAARRRTPTPEPMPEAAEAAPAPAPATPAPEADLSAPAPAADPSTPAADPSTPAAGPAAPRAATARESG